MELSQPKKGKQSSKNRQYSGRKKLIKHGFKKNNTANELRKTLVTKDEHNKVTRKYMRLTEDINSEVFGKQNIENPTTPGLLRPSLAPLLEVEKNAVSSDIPRYVIILT